MKSDIEEIITVLDDISASKFNTVIRDFVQRAEHCGRARSLAVPVMAFALADNAEEADTLLITISDIYSAWERLQKEYAGLIPRSECEISNQSFLSEFIVMQLRPRLEYLGHPWARDEEASGSFGRLLDKLFSKGAEA